MHCAAVWSKIGPDDLEQDMASSLNEVFVDQYCIHTSDSDCGIVGGQEIFDEGVLVVGNHGQSIFGLPARLA